MVDIASFLLFSALFSVYLPAVILFVFLIIFRPKDQLYFSLLNHRWLFGPGR